VKGGPWEPFGGAPRRCGSASVVQRPRGSQRKKMRHNSSARARDGRGGDGFGEGGGKDGFCGGWFLGGEGFVRGSFESRKMLFQRDLWLICEGDPGF
jgi:hypothetical protein